MAKPQFDQLLVVDVESTCWQGSPPERQHSEIIEIGVCLLDLQTLQRGEPVSILVRPTKSEVSPFCTELTTITPELVADAPDFADACQRLRKEFAAQDRVWASWGGYDRNQFERCCKLHGVSYPFNTRHLNLKTMYAVACGRAHETGMAGALGELDLPLAGTHHRGGDDAGNIAAIACEMFRRMRSAVG